MVPAGEGQASDPGAEGSGLDPRKVMLVGAGLVAVFGGLVVWSLLGDAVDTPAGPGPAVEAETKPGDPGEAGPSGDAATRPVPNSEPIEQGRRLERSREITSLLAHPFQRIRPDGSAVFTALRNVLPARGVSVINVWATYCEPCKREFPGFRELQKGWGNNVRFVPIQLGEGDADGLQAVMPEAPDLLVDYMPGGAAKAELEKVGELPRNAPIPITMLLDCRQELRWVQHGEVTDMPAFDREVQTLREELRTPRCAVKPQAVVPSTPPVPANACRNKCKANQICTLRTLDGIYQCLDDLR